MLFHSFISQQKRQTAPNQGPTSTAEPDTGPWCCQQLPPKKQVKEDRMNGLTRSTFHLQIRGIKLMDEDVPPCLPFSKLLKGHQKRTWIHSNTPHHLFMKSVQGIQRFLSFLQSTLIENGISPARQAGFIYLLLLISHKWANRGVCIQRCSCACRLAFIHTFTHIPGENVIAGRKRQPPLTHWSKLRVNGFHYVQRAQKFPGTSTKFQRKISSHLTRWFLWDLPVSINTETRLGRNLLWSEKWLGRRLTAAFNFTWRFLTFINKPNLLFAQIPLMLR